MTPTQCTAAKHLGEQVAHDSGIRDPTELAAAGMEELRWQILEEHYGQPRTMIVPIEVQGQTFHVDPNRPHLYSTEILDRLA